MNIHVTAIVEIVFYLSETESMISLILFIYSGVSTCYKLYHKWFISNSKGKWLLIIFTREDINYETDVIFVASYR